MGDARFTDAYRRLKEAGDRQALLARMGFDELLMALSAASREADPYLANVLATEVLNRYRRGTARVAAYGFGAGSALAALLFSILTFSTHPHNFDDYVFLIVAVISLALGGLVGMLAHSRVLRRLMERTNA